MNINIIIQELNSLIYKEFNDFRGVYFYGSRAKGNYREDSDIDIIIIFDNKLVYKKKLVLARIIGFIEYKYDVFIDFHPMTINELQANPYFSNEVINKGIYYEAA